MMCICVQLERYDAILRLCANMFVGKTRRREWGEGGGGCYPIDIREGKRCGKVIPREGLGRDKDAPSKSIICRICLVLMLVMFEYLCA